MVLSMFPLIQTLFMNKIRIIITSLFIFSSCSYIIKSYQEDTIIQNGISPLDETEVTYCKENSSHILINDNEISQKLFEAYILNLEKKRLITFIDKVVLWSFVQMNLMPHQSSPSAKLQMLIKFKGEEKYYNSYSEQQNSYPYLNLLNHLLKTYKSQYSLRELAVIYGRGIPRGMKVSKSLANFLVANQKELSKDPLLKSIYLRGDEALREKEGLPFLSIKKLIDEYSKSKANTKYEIKNFLFSKFQQNSSFTPQCNFDMNLYKDSIFLISEEKIEAHTFGMKNQDDFFMATSSQSLEKFEPIGGTLSFKGSSNIRSASLCTYKKRLKPKETVWLISSGSRDPGQHLYHLQEYGLDQIDNTATFDSLLRFSRHLFLKNPVRLVIESRRSQEDQIQELLKLDIPIYNAKKLGKIWGFYQSEAQSSFLLDVREEGHIQCFKK